ncbi:MAG TPA: DUF1080 domain-containing protein [Tepidisphaeraceae bacterium]|nr:DUF1080 domain-containing protein [Tepidisphaeraceae bacterium]
MKLASLAFATVVALALAAGYAEDKAAPQADKDGFFQLFNGKDLDGWKAAENPDSFKVQDGVLVVNGPRAHLFYAGPVNKADFKNFHLRAVVQTFPNSNSGIYFHTQFQEKNWPDKGFECQVNNSYAKDRKKTGGLYSVKDVMDTAPAKDGEWFTYDIIVTGKKVVIKINDVVTTEWEQPEGFKGPNEKMGGRVLGHGTIAIQGHDPGSKVMYKSIAIKPLAD